ncbi:MAG TPA: hypothetical protein EYQ74_09930 [Planctomycetes bacterium]|nr:hypothetical protein [Planctomycetota bacterium]HIK60803.1 hypothetical protein [Planctomycetota bacterium]
MTRNLYQGLCLFIVLILVGSQAGAAPQRHVEHHSPEAVWFLSVPDLPGLREAYPRTSLGRLFQDEGLGELIGGLAGEEVDSPLDLGLSFYEKAVLAGKLPPFLPLLEKAEAVSASLVFNGSGLVQSAVQGVFESAEDSALPLFQLQIEFQDAAVAAKAFDMAVAVAAVGGAKIVRKESGQTRIAEASTGLEPQASLVHHGAHLAILLGRPDPESLVQRLQGTAPGLDPKSLGAGSRELVAEGTVVFDWLSRSGFPTGDLIASTPEFAMAELASSMGEALFGANLSMVLRGGHWRSVVDAEGQFVTEGVFEVPARPASRLLSSEPMTENALGLLPQDAMVQWCASLNKSALEELTSGLPGSEEAGLDFDYRSDLLAPLGSSIAVGLPKPKSLLAAPPIIGVIALEDAAAFKRGMDGLAAWGAKEGAGVLTIKVDEYRGRPLYTLQFNASEAEAQSLELPTIMIGMEGLMRPCLAILDDRVILTPLPNHTKRELRRALKDEDAGSGAFALEGVPSGASGAAQADWASFLGSVYGGLKALASMGAAGGNLPIDVAALPESDYVESFFEPSLSWMEVNEGRGYAYQRSSFGPEFMLMTGLVPIWFVTDSSVQTVAIPSSVPAAPTSGDIEEDGNSQQR